MTRSAMAIVQTDSRDILDALKRMRPEEFDAFIEEALSVRPRITAATLSTEETKLLERINRGLPEEIAKRYTFLIGRRRKGILTDNELKELLRLTHEAESQDADRAAALL